MWERFVLLRLSKVQPGIQMPQWNLHPARVGMQRFSQVKFLDESSLAGETIQDGDQRQADNADNKGGVKGLRSPGRRRVKGLHQRSQTLKE